MEIDVGVVDVTRHGIKRGAFAVSTIAGTLTECDATLHGVSSSISGEAFNGQQVVLLNNKNLPSLIHRHPK